MKNSSRNNELEQQIVSKLHILDDFSLQKILDFAEFLYSRGLPATSAPTKKIRLPGSAKGLLKIYEDFSAPLDDFKDYM